MVQSATDSEPDGIKEAMPSPRLVKSLPMRRENGKTPQSWGLFECPYCKRHFEMRLSQKKKNRSCGCAKNRLCAEVKTKHGFAPRTTRRPKIYKAWCGIKDRCLNPNAPQYQWYGGKGVTVAPEWMEFEPFRKWSMANGYGPSLEIDRIDGDGPYSPDNCRWVTKVKNNRNRCATKLDLKTARKIREEFRPGLTCVLAKKYGVSDGTITCIIKMKTWIKDDDGNLLPEVLAMQSRNG